MNDIVLSVKNLSVSFTENNKVKKVLNNSSFSIQRGTTLSIVGERGMAIIGGVALNELQQWEFINKDPDDDLATERFSQAVPNGYGLGHIPLLNEISNSLKSNSIIPPLNALEGAKAVELVHALYASIELNKTIELDKKIRSRQLGK